METLRKILSSLHPDVDFDRETDLASDGILDSFDIVTILAEVHGEYGISIPVEELTPENFASLRSLYALIQRLEGM